MKKQIFGKIPFGVIGMAIGALLVIVGIFFMSGDFGHTASYGLGGSEWRYTADKGYASFGGDAYTFMNNNMAFAAKNTYSADKNAQEIGDILNSGIGMFFIAFGLLSICYFGMQLAKEEKCNEACAVKEKAETVDEAESADEAETAAEVVSVENTAVN